MNKFEEHINALNQNQQENKTKKKSKSKSKIKRLVIGGIIVAVITTSLVLVHDDEIKTIKEKLTKTKKITTTTDFNLEDEINRIRIENPEMTYDQAEWTAKYENRDILLEIDPESLYETTGIVKSTPITKDDITDVVLELANDLKDLKAITLADTEKAIVILNIDRISSNAELLNEYLNGENTESYLQTANDVLDAIIAANNRIWSNGEDLTNLILPSKYIISQRDRAQAEKAEEYVKKLIACNGNSEEMNKVIKDFLEEIRTGELSFIDNTVERCMFVYYNLIVSSLSRQNPTDNYILISQENMNDLITEMNKYDSVKIKNILNGECTAKTKTLTK